MARSDQPAIARLSRLIQFPTVSARIDETPVAESFASFFEYLATAYPALFSGARVTRGEPWRLVLEVPGSDPELEPVLFIAHYDVVDVNEETEAEWRFPPFSGTVAEGYVWGRGALDDKNVLGAMLEATERLLATGNSPFRRGLVLAFGGDEELMGSRGAGEISRRFREAGRRFAFSIDEGSVIAEGILSAPKKPIAMIGLSEKGYANIRVTAEQPGGHASMPPSSTAVGTIARAVSRIEARPFPARQIPTVRAFFRYVGGETSGLLGLVYRHTQLLWPLVRRILKKGRSTNALIRTTTAPTMARGSSVPNVLPQRAEAVVNVRILPGDTIESVLERFRRMLRGIDVEVSLVNAAECHEAAPESPIDHFAFDAIAAGARALVPDAVVAPFLVPGATDSKWYAGLTGGSYRFVPLLLGEADIGTIHGTDERVSVDGYLGMIDFYEGLIEKICLE